MHERYTEDEVARRRAARRGKQVQEELLGEREEEIPHYSWTDTFAMIIAAYQVLLPMVLAMAGVLVLAYLLFRFIFR
jgi:hypothetical protein